MVKIRKQLILLKPGDIRPTSNKFEVLGVLNPAAVRLSDGRILLYVRVVERLKKFEDKKYFYSPRMVGKNSFNVKVDRFRKGLVSEGNAFGFDFKNGTKRLTYFSYLKRVFLDESGLNIMKIDSRPSFYGLSWDSELGVEDARITKISGMYYMVYVSLTRSESISVSVAESSDCIHWKRLGIIFGEQDKDVVLFSEKFNKQYFSFIRPEGNFQFTPPHMWYAFSKNLTHWGQLKSLNLNSHVNFSRTGAGPPPIKTDRGWLLIFHGVTRERVFGFWDKVKKMLGFRVKEDGTDYSGNDIYSVWALLLDKDDPRKIIAQTKKPIIVPNKKEDVSPEGKKVVFPTGIVEDKDSRSVLLYCGLGDVYVGVKKIKIKDILKQVE